MLDFNLNLSDNADASELYDLIIIGGGPAGLTAGLYAARYKLKTLMLEKSFISGGQLTSTEWVENYPGFPERVLGQKLAQDMEKQARHFGLRIITEMVKSVELTGSVKKIHTDYGTWQSKTVLICTGSSSRKLGIDDEDLYTGRGISYCATCDGPLYPDKVVAVIGGGNSAFEEAIFLSKYASKVYIVHRSESFRADKILQDRVVANDKIELVTNAEIDHIDFADDEHRKLYLIDRKTNEMFKLDIDGIFVFIGNIPNTSIFDGQIELEKGYIVTDRTHKTNQEGVWAAGDVQAKALRQVATAVGDGACAAFWINKYVDEWQDIESLSPAKGTLDA